MSNKIKPELMNKAKELRNALDTIEIKIQTRVNYIINTLVKEFGGKLRNWSFPDDDFWKSNDANDIFINIYIAPH